MAGAMFVLQGRPGMHKFQQQDALSHAKMLLIQALGVLETASHEVNIRNTREQMSEKLDHEIAAAVNDVEAMLTNFLDSPVKDKKTDNTEEN